MDPSYIFLHILKPPVETLSLNAAIIHHFDAVSLRMCICPSPPLEATTYFLSVYDLIHWWLYESGVINGGIQSFFLWVLAYP